MDLHEQRRLPVRRLERLPQLDRALQADAFALDVAEENERLGTPTNQRPGLKLEREHTSTASITRVKAGAGRCNRAAIPILGGPRRREAKRVLGELGRGDNRPPSRWQLCGLLQHRGDLFVGPVAGKREVPGALDRIVHDRGEASMSSSPLFLGRLLVEDRSEQRMGESDRVGRKLDHLRCERRLERRRTDPCGAEESRRRPAVRGSHKQRLPRRSRESREASGHQPLQRLWNRKRLHRIDGRACRIKPTSESST